ncbi:hypothetical protein YC2023_011562 [Brassica napus]
MLDRIRNWGWDGEDTCRLCGSEIPYKWGKMIVMGGRKMEGFRVWIANRVSFGCREYNCLLGNRVCKSSIRKENKIRK